MIKLKHMLTEVQVKSIDAAINSVISKKNLKKLVKAISNKEGWIATSNAGLGSRAYRNNNPGNLDYQSSFKQIDPGVKREKKLQGGKLTDEDGRFAHFSTPEFGVKALRDKIIRWAKGNMPTTAGNQSLIARDFGEEFKWKRGTPPTVLQFMYTYAPPNENSSINYVDYILQQFGLEANDTNRNQPMINVLSSYPTITVVGKK